MTHTKKLIAVLLMLMSTLAFVACETEVETETAEETVAGEEVAAEAMEEKMVYPADSVGEDGQSFHGMRISTEGAADLAELSTMMGDNAEMPVKLTGTVTDVCQKKGCWMTMSLPNGDNMRVTFRDYGFFVPKDATDKTAVIEGVAFLDTTSVEDLRHYAEDGGKSPEEIAQITEPEIALNFEATGVVIK